MGANFNPNITNIEPSKEFRFWCQKVIPLVYDDSLSYYEVLCKVVNYLNSMIGDVNTLAENNSELARAYTELQSYVNNYFDNVNFQNEINTRLQEMYETGELQDIINQAITLSPYINVNYYGIHPAEHYSWIEAEPRINGGLREDERNVANLKKLLTWASSGTDVVGGRTTLFFPAGHYEFGAQAIFQVQDNITIKGEGPSTAFMFKEFTPAGTIFYLRGDNITIENISLGVNRSLEHSVDEVLTNIDGIDDKIFRIFPIEINPTYPQGLVKHSRNITIKNIYDFIEVDSGTTWGNDYTRASFPIFIDCVYGGEISEVDIKDIVMRESAIVIRNEENNKGALNKILFDNVDVCTIYSNSTTIGDNIYISNSTMGLLKLPMSRTFINNCNIEYNEYYDRCMGQVRPEYLVQLGNSCLSNCFISSNGYVGVGGLKAIITAKTYDEKTYKNSTVNVVNTIIDVLQNDYATMDSNYTSPTTSKEYYSLIKMSNCTCLNGRNRIGGGTSNTLLVGGNELPNKLYITINSNTASNIEGASDNYIRYVDGKLKFRLEYQLPMLLQGRYKALEFIYGQKQFLPKKNDVLYTGGYLLRQIGTGDYVNVPLLVHFKSTDETSEIGVSLFGPEDVSFGQGDAAIVAEGEFEM